MVLMYNLWNAEARSFEFICFVKPNLNSPLYWTKKKHKLQIYFKKHFHYIHWDSNHFPGEIVPLLDDRWRYQCRNEHEVRHSFPRGPRNTPRRRFNKTLFRFILDAACLGPRARITVCNYASFFVTIRHCLDW